MSVQGIDGKVGRSRPMEAKDIMPVSGTTAINDQAPLVMRRGVVDFLSALAVSLVSAILLVYVGYAEAERAWPGVRDERAAALATILGAGLAADRDATGVRTDDAATVVRRAAVVVNADPSVRSVTLTDTDGRTLAAAGPGSGTAADVPAATVALDDGRRLSVSVEDDAEGALHRPFAGLLGTMTVLSVVAAGLAAAMRGRFGERGSLAAGGLLFVSMAVLVGGTLAGLHLDSLDAKARVLSALIGQQLAEGAGASPVGASPVAVTRLLGGVAAAGMGAGMEAAVLRDGRIVAHAGADRIGEPWAETALARDHRVVAVSAAGPVEVVVRTSPLVLLERADLRRTVKNFAVLLAAAGFLAQLFQQMVGALRTDGSRLLGLRTRARELGETTLERVKPVFFLAVLIENMGYSFLPALLKDVVAGSGLPPGVSSALFMTYFFGFALILVPSGQMAGRYGPKPLVTIGAALVAAGMGLMALTLDALAMGLARFMVGIGQGMILIGVQSYILEVAAVGHRTRGTAIVVYGFNTGMIAGIALGSLLVEHLGAQGVFLLSSGIALLLLAFAQGLLPALARPINIAGGGLSYALRELGRNTARALTSPAFIRATFLVGIPNKAVMTGIILFALPLLLNQQGMSAEDIGQIIMFYAAGMLTTSPIVSRIVDRIGETRRVLFIGSFISGVGLLLIGATAWPGLAGVPNREILVTAMMIVAVLVIGAAHGFVNAPVVTHVAELAIAQEVGSARVAATYRFLERLGHVAGPIVVGQALVLVGSDASTIAWIGVVVIAFALLFRVRPPRRGAAASRTKGSSDRRRNADPHR